MEGNYVFIRAVPPLPGWSLGEEIEFPPIVDWDRSHFLTRYLTLDNLTVYKANQLGAPPWAEKVLESRDTPMIVSFREGKIRGVVIAFDIYDSDWPFHASFPIFFSNLIGEYTTGGNSSLLTRRTGDIVVLEPPEEGSASMTILKPVSGHRLEVSTAGDAPLFFNETDEVGVYLQPELPNKRSGMDKKSMEDEAVRSLPLGRTETGGGAGRVRGA